MPKRPVVDQDLCVGCGYCEDVCPEMFALVNDKSTVIGFDRDSAGDCHDVFDGCLVHAISWDDQTGCQGLMA